MKKYWKVMVTAIIVVLAIGTFYTTSAMSAAGLPEFIIQKQSGDASLVHSVTIRGAYGQGSNHKLLSITATGSKYDSEMSFFEQLGGHHQPMIEQLIKEHRNFMRGKDNSIDSFYEDNHVLAYAGVVYQTTALSPKDFKLSIAILNKENKHVTSYEIPVPYESNVDHMIVDDVQIMNGKLKVITNNLKGPDSTIHIYTIDMATKKLMADQPIIASSANGLGSYTYAGLLNESNPTKSQKYVVFEKRVEEGVGQNGGQTSNTSAKEREHRTLMTYSLATGERKRIVLPEKLKKDFSKDQMDPVQAFGGTVLYFTTINNNELTITPFNIENEQAGKVIKISFPKGHPGSPPLIVIKNDKIYALSPFLKKKSFAALTVVDLKSGETLYKGKVVEKNPSKGKKKYGLYLFQMTVE